MQAKWGVWWEILRNCMRGLAATLARNGYVRRQPPRGVVAVANNASPLAFWVLRRQRARARRHLSSAFRPQLCPHHGGHAPATQQHAWTQHTHPPTHPPTRAHTQYTRPTYFGFARPAQQGQNMAGANGVFLCQSDNRYSSGPLSSDGVLDPMTQVLDLWADLTNSTVAQGEQNEETCE
jgi:hypothetical protein